LKHALDRLLIELVVILFATSVDQDRVILLSFIYRSVQVCDGDHEPIERLLRIFRAVIVVGQKLQSIVGFLIRKKYILSGVERMRSKAHPAFVVIPECVI
jgi:hypothetical protein